MQYKIFDIIFGIKTNIITSSYKALYDCVSIYPYV